MQDYVNSISKEKFHNLVVIDQKNQGHGATILTGYNHAISIEAEWIFQVDSDNQFFPQDILKIVNGIRQYILILIRYNFCLFFYF